MLQLESLLKPKEYLELFGSKPEAVLKKILALPSVAPRMDCGVVLVGLNAVCEYSTPHFLALKPGDGNCMFHTVAMHLAFQTNEVDATKIRVKSEEIRQAAADYIFNQPTQPPFRLNMV